MEYQLLWIMLIILIVKVNTQSYILKAKYIHNSKAFAVNYTFNQHILYDCPPNISNIDGTPAKNIEMSIAQRDVIVKGENSSLLERINFRVFFGCKNFTVTLCLTDDYDLEGEIKDHRDTCPESKTDKIVLDTYSVNSARPFKLEYDLKKYKLKERNIIVNDNHGNRADNIKASLKSGILILEGRNSSLLTKSKYRVNINRKSFIINLVVLGVYVVETDSLTLLSPLDVRQYQGISWCHSTLHINDCYDIKLGDSIFINSSTLHIANFTRRDEKRYCLKSASDLIICWDTIQLRRIEFLPNQNEIEIHLPIHPKDIPKLEFRNVKTNKVNRKLKIEMKKDRMFLVNRNMKKHVRKYALYMFNNKIAHIFINADNSQKPDTGRRGKLVSHTKPNSRIGIIYDENRRGWML